MTYPDGSILKCFFLMGRIFFKSKMILKNGDKYAGHMLNDKMHGQGKLTYKSGASYEGRFKNGKRDGKGIIKYRNGN